MYFRLRRILILIIAIQAPLLFAATPQSSLVYLNTPAAQHLVDTADDKADLYNLMQFFESQQTQAYCGVASAVIVLNALGVPPPTNPVIYPYQRYNQSSVFTDQVLQLGLTPEFVNSHGLTLDEEGQLLSATVSLDVQVNHLSDHTTASAKQQILAAIKKNNHYVIVNFLRPGLGQKGYGHFSIVAAYNKASNSVLVLDVARYKHPPFWVKLDDLIAAMNTVDSTSKKTRGFILVSNKSPSISSVS